MNDELDFKKLESAIGKLVLACSRVEYELIGLYEKWLPTRTYHDDSYIGKYDRAIKVAQSSLNNGAEISQKLNEMKKLSEYRHSVAHNPVHYSSETDTWEITDLKKGKKTINIRELEALARKANSLSIELSTLLRINV